jgi:hypothetical protein
MPKPNKKNYPYNPRKLHKELRESGLNVVSVNSSGYVILSSDPSPEERQLIIKIKSDQVTGLNP